LLHLVLCSAALYAGGRVLSTLPASIYNTYYFSCFICVHAPVLQSKDGVRSSVACRRTSRRLSPDHAILQVIIAPVLQGRSFRVFFLHLWCCGLQRFLLLLAMKSALAGLQLPCGVAALITVH
jgi:hypothetical protein